MIQRYIGSQNTNPLQPENHYHTAEKHKDSQSYQAPINVCPSHIAPNLTNDKNPLKNSAHPKGVHSNSNSSLPSHISNHLRDPETHPGLSHLTLCLASSSRLALCFSFSLHCHRAGLPACHRTGLPACHRARLPACPRAKLMPAFTPRG